MFVAGRVCIVVYVIAGAGAAGVDGDCVVGDDGRCTAVVLPDDDDHADHGHDGDDDNDDDDDDDDGDGLGARAGGSAAWLAGGT